MKWILPVTIVLLLFAACSSAPTLMEASAEFPPVWTQKTVFRLKGKVFFVGRSKGSSTQNQARDEAMKDALSVLIRSIHPKATSSLQMEQVTKNGATQKVLTVRIPDRKAAVLVPGIILDQEYHEEWRRDGRIEFDSWLTASMAQETLDAAKWDIEDATLLAWRCQIKPSSLCDSRFMTPIKEALERAGFKVVGKLARIRGETTPLDLGRKTGSARVAAVTLSTRYLGSPDDEAHLAQGQASIEIWSTSSQSISHAVQTGILQAGHFSQLDAVRAAAANSIVELARRMQFELKH